MNRASSHSPVGSIAFADNKKIGQSPRWCYTCCAHPQTSHCRDLMQWLCAFSLYTLIPVYTGSCKIIHNSSIIPARPPPFWLAKKFENIHPTVFRFKLRSSVHVGITRTFYTYFSKGGTPTESFIRLVLLSHNSYKQHLPAIIITPYTNYKSRCDRVD